MQAQFRAMSERRYAFLFGALRHSALGRKPGDTGGNWYPEAFTFVRNPHAMALPNS